MLDTLNKHPMPENLKKCQCAQHYFFHIKYVICGREMKIDVSKMEAIMKIPVPTNVSEVRSFVGEAQFVRKFIASFSVVVATLHAITVSGKIFQWGRGRGGPLRIQRGILFKH